MAPGSTHFDLIVIGAGPVGMHLARRVGSYLSVLVLDADPDSPDASESRARLLRLLAQGPAALTAQRGPIRPPNIVVRAATRVVVIERAGRAVVTSRRERFGYSHLVLALGASPRIPNLDGRDLVQAQTAYRRSEIARIAGSAAANESIVIVGGGLLAVEMAAAIADAAHTTLLARGRLLSGYASAAIAERVVGRLRRLGVTVRTGCPIARIDGDGRVESVSDHRGRRIRADRVVFACGMRPNVGLARAAGLSADHGIVTDDAMRTSDARVFAIGDCVQAQASLARGSVASGIRQAERVIVALHEGRVGPPIQAAVLSREIDLRGFRFVTVNRRPAEPACASGAVRRRLSGRIFTVDFCGRYIADCQALLPGGPAVRLVHLAQSGEPLSAVQRLCLRLGWIPRPSASSDAIVCQCAGVRRANVMQAARRVGADLDAIGQATGAGRYCGGCMDDLASLLGTRSRRRWLAVAAGLCVLCLAAIAAWLPQATTGSSARDYWFVVYSVLSGHGVQQISGWLAFGFIALALTGGAGRRRPGERRGLWLHLLYGALALVLIPLHALGGVIVGAGINGVLVPIFLVCVGFGALAWLKRSLRMLAWLHVLATVALLSSVALHVIDVYQY